MRPPAGLLEGVQAFLASPRQEGDLTLLQAILDGLDPALLTVPRRLERMDRGQAWSSVGWVETQDVELTLFLMPAGAVIPLHDHPGMHGLVRLLSGRVALTAYDWVDRDAALVRPALQADFGVEDPLPPLLPERRNVHEVRALSDVAFLDLFLPPYAPKAGRACTYFRVVGSGDALRLEPLPG